MDQSIAVSKGFFDELRAGLAAPGRCHANHPIMRSLADGSAPIDQLKRWIIEMYLRVDAGLQHFGVIYAKCPDAGARRGIFDNLMEEERGLFSGTDGHLVLLRRYADALGITEQEWAHVAANLSLETRAMIWYERAIAYTQPWYAWFSAVGIGEEAQVPTYFDIVSQASRKHYGVTKNDDLQFWTVHITADAEHGEVTEKLLAKHLRTKEQQDEAKDAVFTLAELLYDQMTAAARQGLQ
jgi:pyrroloquinoline-quinone synthase